MTRTFLLLSFVSTALLFAGAVFVLRSPLAGIAAVPAAFLHCAVLLAFSRAEDQRTRAYLPVVRKPAITALSLLAIAPYTVSAGQWIHFSSTWTAALVSAMAFHVEYQSIRESEHARRHLR